MTHEHRTRSRATHVTVLGQDYVLSGDIDPDYVSKIAGYVNERMKELHDRTVGVSTTRLAVLTAINIADEMFTLRSEMENAELIGVSRIDQLEGRIGTWLSENEGQRIPKQNDPGEK